VSDPKSLGYLEASYIIIEAYADWALDNTNYPSITESQEKIALEHIFAFSTGSLLSSDSGINYRSVNDQDLLAILE